MKILQEIGAILLTGYEIIIDEHTIIHPLRVEAYYYPYREKEKFDDEFAHPSTKKIGNFGKLYFIEEKYGYPGIDICLSMGDYYLSFLIKNSYIDDTPYKQMSLYDLLKDRWEEIEAKNNVLFKITNNKEIVFNTVRVGLPKKRPFAGELLASVIRINYKDVTGKTLYNWQPKHGKMWTIANYLYDHPEDNNIEWIRKILGYNGTKEINNYLNIIEKERYNQ